MNFEKICIVGLGYIGLPTATMFTAKGINVVGVDINSQAVDTINNGFIHIIEPGLGEAVKSAVEKKLLRAQSVPESADAFLIAVPTPFKEDHQPDTSYIESACLAIAPYLNKGNIVILESTSPVGTTEQMAEWLQSARPDLVFPRLEEDEPDVYLAHCPERVLPGCAMRELIQNDRVIGGITPKCSAKARELYLVFVEGECVLTNSRTAELAKLTENSFRDVNIAFANELSIICDKLKIDVWELIRLANRHPRVGILQPGTGVGGHCIAVDPWFIVAGSPEEARLIRTARQVNDYKPHWLIDKIKISVAEWLLERPEKTVKDITLACYGLAFKPDIDDLRESPAVKVVNMLANDFAGTVVVAEPYIEVLPDSVDSKVVLASTEESRKRADVEVILVGHTVFIPFFESDELNLIDACGLLKRKRIEKKVIAAA